MACLRTHVGLCMDGILIRRAFYHVLWGVRRTAVGSQSSASSVLQLIPRIYRQKTPTERSPAITVAGKEEETNWAPGGGWRGERAARSDIGRTDGKTARQGG